MSSKPFNCTNSDGSRTLLWGPGAPGALGNEPKDCPWYSVHLPAKPSSKPMPAVVVCPGGGYQGLSEDHEGIQPANWLNNLGIAAFVLRYRLAPSYHHPTPLLDARRIVRTARTRAGELGIDPDRIGIWGFSAGGHLAASAGTFFEAGNPESDDPIERVSSRPDFMVLSYPVICMQPPFTHQGSSTSLTQDDPELMKLLSLENAVTLQTPPTFLFHTDGDEAVPSENSVRFYLALRKAHVQAEMHVFKDGWHGLGLKTMEGAPHPWMDLLRDWLAASNILP